VSPVCGGLKSDLDVVGASSDRRESIRILVSEDFPTLIEVCKKVGYLNYRTFKRAFKRRVGICPSECVSSVKALTDIGELSDKLMLRLDSDKKNAR